MKRREIMKKSKFPLPPQYWIYLSLCVIMAILLFVNIFVTNAITGEKEFYEFSSNDWHHFILFIISELLIGFLMFLFGTKAGKFARQVDKQKKNYYEQSKYDGIEPGDYDYVWFDFSGEERAKILKQDDVFLLYVEAFDVRSEIWTPVNTVSCFESIDAVKKSLYYDFDFYCDENALLDEHGDEVFKQ